MTHSHKSIPDDSSWQLGPGLQQRHESDKPQPRYLRLLLTRLQCHLQWPGLCRGLYNHRGGVFSLSLHVPAWLSDPPPSVMPKWDSHGRGSYTPNFRNHARTPDPKQSCGLAKKHGGAPSPGLCRNFSGTPCPPQTINRLPSSQEACQLLSPEIYRLKMKGPHCTGVGFWPSALSATIGSIKVTKAELKRAHLESNGGCLFANKKRVRNPKNGNRGVTHED